MKLKPLFTKNDDPRNGRKIGLASRLMVSMTFNFFIALVVFVIASYLLIPHLLKHEAELQALRQEVTALNQRLNATEAPQNVLPEAPRQAEAKPGTEDNGPEGDGDEAAKPALDDGNGHEGRETPAGV